MAIDVGSTLTTDQKLVLSHIMSGENVFVTGIGGSGKSYLLENVKTWADAVGKNYVVCAPTGISALNVGGCTIHRAFDIRPGDEMQLGAAAYVVPNGVIDKCDLFIIDEISMCRCDLFDYVSKTINKAQRWREKRGKDKAQLVVVGDFYQLPPVVPNDARDVLKVQYEALGKKFVDGYPFEGIWWDTWDFVTVSLTEPIRQKNVEFVDALNECRKGDVNGLQWIVNNASRVRPNVAIELCGTNKLANEINDSHLLSLPGREKVFRAQVRGRINPSDEPTERELILKVGARVMSLVNDAVGHYMNGSLGTVTRLATDGVYVRFDGGRECFIKRHTWEIVRPEVDGVKVSQHVVGMFIQLPLRLAWAITMHKSQGQTFDNVILHPHCFTNGQLYVGLSRVRDIENLYFDDYPSRRDLRVSKSVLEFFNKNDEVI